MTETQAHLAFSAFVPLGPTRFKLLVEYFGSALKAWQANRQKLAQLGMSSKILADWAKFKSQFDLAKYQADLDHHQIKILCLKDTHYPKLLKKTEDPPIILYFQGSLAPLKFPALAVVGSRRLTPYGHHMAEKLVSELADYSLTVVSGLMYGIDEVAHRTALKSGLPTIGVWAGGLDTLSGSRRGLATTIIKKGGLIISEYPLGFLPSLVTFPIRNRIVSGLSVATLVVEAAHRSGSLITASHAARQGREVMAVPGPANSQTSQGTNGLIQKGAKLVQDTPDILEELNLKPKPPSQTVPPTFNKTTTQVLELIAPQPLHINEVVRHSHLPTAEVSGILTHLELSGKIKHLGSGIYSLA